MTHYTTLVPAYGRDYTSAKLALQDWHDGKDFIIMDISSPWDGKPMSVRDAQPGTVYHIRYAGQSKICTAK